MTVSELEQKYPCNHVLTDLQNNPSVMVYVPKFLMDEVIDGAQHVPHPAFLVDGQELDGIYISKFQNVIQNGLAYSLPSRDPATHVTFDEAWNACAAKGTGYHLMTAAEWGALALWCQKNGTLPFGNNDAGKDVREATATARLAYHDPEKAIYRTATGSGPVEWSHNRRTDGIYDLNGNVWEWMGGMRLVFGELQVLPNNNAASSRYSQAPDADAWMAIDGTTGAFITPNGLGTTQNSIKLDFVNGCWFYTCGEIQSADPHFRFCKFADVTADRSLSPIAREYLLAIGCLPVPNCSDHDVELYANNGKPERMAFRGGRWGQGLNAGILKTCFDDPRTYSGDAVGFRSAYYEISR